MAPRLNGHDLHPALTPAPALTRALIDCLELLAEIHYCRLPSDALQMQRRTGQRPTVWIDPTSSDDDLCTAMIGVMQVLAGTSEQDAGAHPVRHLRSVG